MVAAVQQHVQGRSPQPTSTRESADPGIDISKPTGVEDLTACGSTGGTA